MFTDWVETTPEPEYGPFCPGIHIDGVWEMYIEEGKVTLTSGCQECDSVVWDPCGGEDVLSEIVIKGHMQSHVERYIDDVDHWWEFIPEAIGED